ncbi:MAG: transporter substrate-binding protein [Aeromicrobium sp.]|jgi:His/Glu/Gln/Arg/opine family amino acid ABC transporter permease subunit|uniref:ABC transporter substrate-binding protein/permease n=1 Tax=Aeromicrobium sp. TaxID=1871063 RepID=UPI00261B1667|nr:ABC transporter substrate-binding protein/permease [Aeromicrobium sp.]MCW2788560.1 transporter substrate-binding protein [Aeromicrobium sp.]MCW2823792.1 transporter substrate-binding protein [Aeromicrobium sp.]
MRHVARLLALMLVGLVILPMGAATAAEPDRPLVRVGTEGVYPPFSFHDAKTDELTGYDIEVIKAVADKAGWRLEFVETQFDAIFAALEAERIDVIANQVTVNPERQAKYGLGTPYTYSRGVIVVKKGTKGITSLDDVKGKTAAESTTTSWADVARKAGAKIQAVEGFSQAAALVVQGRADLLINDNIAVLDYLNTTGKDDIEIVGNAGSDVSKQALAFRKGDPRLEESNRALAELKADGTLKKISEKYFKTDVSVEGGGEADLSGGRAVRSDTEVVKDAAWPMLKKLVIVTIPLTIVSFAIGLVLAVAAALARISGNRVLGGIARGYISIIRGTPLLLQLFIVFYGLPEIGIDLPPWPSAILALSLNVGGYAAEVVRSAILSVPKGQFEAAWTVGMGYWQSLRRIVFPQAARTAVPPLSNTAISLLKDTSLVSVVLLTDVFRQGQLAAANAQVYLPIYVLAGFYYWVVCVGMSSVQGKLETRLNRFVAA